MEFLLQHDALNQLHPVAYISHKLEAAQRNYTIGELEMLAVVHALRCWRCFLEGAEFTIWTDHSNLTSFLTTPTINGRQSRWASFVQQFLPGMTTRYKRGADNMADALSRRPDHAAIAGNAATVGNAATAGNAAAAGNATAILNAVETSTNDKDLESKLQAAFNEDPTWIQQLTDADLYCIQGLWFKGPKLVVPPSLRKYIFDEHHATTIAGHLGRDKTYAAISAVCWWPTLYADVKEWCRLCIECQKNKPDNRSPAGYLRPLPIPTQPWESLSMDLMTDLPVTADGFDSIVVFCCRLTKMLHFVPCAKTVTAPELAQLFIQHVFRTHGLPASIVSDRDPRFTSHFWKTVFTLLGTQLNMSTAFHPQTDGQSERAFSTLQQMLRAVVNPRQNDWSEYLPLLEFAYNNSKQASTGFAPFSLCYGRQPATPFTRSLPSSGHVPAADTYVAEL